MFMKKIYDRLTGRETSLAVIGLGYVGVPVALRFARRFDVVGYDMDAGRIEKLREKYGAGGIMGAGIKDLFTNGIPDGYDGLLWIELLTVKHTLTAAEQIKQEGDFVSEMTDAEPLSLREEENSDDNA